MVKKASHAEQAGKSPKVRAVNSDSGKDRKPSHPEKANAGRKQAVRAVRTAAGASKSKRAGMLIIHSAKKQQRAALKAADREMLRQSLIALRERLSGNMSALRQESLLRHDSSNSEEDGTDAFERQLALGLVNNEHERVLAIDDALLRLDGGSYGICESCHGCIEVPRLKALPFVRMCIACQSEKEKAAWRVRPVVAMGS